MEKLRAWRREAIYRPKLFPAKQIDSNGVHNIPSKRSNGLGPQVMRNLRAFLAGVLALQVPPNSWRLGTAYISIQCYEGRLRVEPSFDAWSHRTSELLFPL